MLPPAEPYPACGAAGAVGRYDCIKGRAAFFTGGPALADQVVQFKPMLRQKAHFF